MLGAENGGRGCEQGLVSCTVLDREGQLEAENQFLLDHNNILQQLVKLSKITSNEKAKNIAKRSLLVLSPASVEPTVVSPSCADCRERVYIHEQRR